MLSNNENNILKFIRFAPISFIFILSILITYLFIIENKNKLQQDIYNLEQEYFESKKILVKNEVNRVYDYILYQKKLSETNLKEQLKQRVYEAHKIATNIYNENKTKNKTVILKMIKDALREIRFNEGRGYYFMHNIKGDNILYPLDKDVEGNNYSKLKDINGYYFVQTIMNTIKNKTETFDSYYWNIPADNPKDTKNRIYKKFAFYKYFEPLNISISTGEYLEDHESRLKKKILEYINNIKYDSDGYIFVIHENKKILAHINEKLINSYIPKENGKKNITDNIIEFVKVSNGFIKYKTIYHHKTREYVEKTSYIKAFQEWQWVIGSGFYRDRLDNAINKRTTELDEYHSNYLFNIFIIILLVTIILLIVSIYLSNQIQNRFIKYRNKIYNEMEKNRKKDSILAQQSKMAAMGEMIGNIAHQWRQPLSLISTASTSLKLKKELGLLNENEVVETSNIITNATKHLSKTIDDFRNFFKPDKEKMHCQVEELWLRTNDLIKDQYKTKNIQIITNIEDITIHTLVNELIQVILNIINNSRDELVKKELENKYIFVDIHKNVNKLQIQIKDNAGGIPKHIINRIFEPYFTTKHQSQGTGIGLYMSQEIVKKHMKGSIEVENSTYTYNKIEYTGAVFTINIELNL